MNKFNGINSTVEGLGRLLFIVIFTLASQQCLQSQQADPLIESKNTQSTNSYILDQYMACAVMNMHGAPPAELRIWAFVLLNMPNHASELLQSSRRFLAPAEVPMFEKRVAEGQSRENEKSYRLLLKYLRCGNSNTLFETHLATLTNSIGAQIMKDKDFNEESISRALASGETPILLVRCSEKWMMDNCARMAGTRLAKQSAVISCLCSQPMLRTFVIVSQKESEAISLEILRNEDNGHRPKSAFVPLSETLLTRDDENDIATLAEDVALETLEVAGLIKPKATK